MRLALACCRFCMGDDNPLEVRRLFEAAGPAATLELSARHRIAGLLFAALQQSGCAVPAALADDAEASARQALAAAAFSGRLLQRFEEEAIPLLFLKGLAVGKLAWGNAFLKSSWDIDLLVLPQDVSRAAGALERLGVQPLQPPAGVAVERWHRRHKESVWRSSSGLHLELHGRVADAPALLTTLDACSPVQRVPIHAGISLPTFARDELFAYLCVHGASSAWFRLKWIADLAGLVRRLGAAEVERLFDRSQQLGADRSAHQALLLIAWLFGPLSSSGLQRRLEADRPALLLARAALHELLAPREPTRRPLGTAVIHLSQLALLPGLRFPAAELLRQARGIVRP